MKINCVSCGHKVDLDDAYSDYQGQVKCLPCGSLLEVKIEDGGIRSVRLVRVIPRPVPVGAVAHPR